MFRENLLSIFIMLNITYFIHLFAFSSSFVLTQMKTRSVEKNKKSKKGENFKNKIFLCNISTLESLCFIKISLLLTW